MAAVLVVIALGVVLAVGVAGGRLAAAVRLPRVVGQMVFGVLLGPPALGEVWHSGYAWLFPAPSRSVIATLGSVSAAVFLFMIGAGEHRRTGMPRRDITLITGGNMVTALAGAVAVVPLAAALTGHPVGVPTTLFLGAALALSALPVMARLLDERGLTRTAAGRCALAIAMATDVVAWCGVALLGGLNGHGPVWRAVAETGAVVAMVLAWPLLRAGAVAVLARARTWPAVLAVAAGCAGVGIGPALAVGLDPALGALAGGLLFGTARARVPGGAAAGTVALHRIAQVNAAVLLPVFFASAGLSARVSGSARSLVLLTVLFSAVAIVARLAGTLLPRRWLRLGPADLRMVCCLVCARGATELVFLQVGLREGLLPPDLYPPALLMALVTTALSGLGLSVLTGSRPVPVGAFRPVPAEPVNRTG